MTKTIEQIQKENRKFILEAIHGCSYEEALKKEEGRTCEYLYQTNYGVRNIIGDVKDYGYNRKKHFPDAFLIKIIGRPITLDRVLLVFKNKEVKSFYRGEYKIFFNIESSQFCELKLEGYLSPHYLLYDSFGNWDLELETLEQQSEETQRVINELLTKSLIDKIKK